MKRRVLFLCTGNSARSQMAEALLRHLAGDRFEVFSAGTNPRPVHPQAVAVMRERDIDISSQTSKHVDQFKGQTFDYMITLCERAQEQCPTFISGTEVINWSFPDPSASGRRYEFEVVASEIKKRLDYLILIDEKKVKAGKA